MAVVVQTIPRPKACDARSRSPLANTLMELVDTGKPEVGVLHYSGEHPSRRLRIIRRILNKFGYGLHYRYERDKQRVVCWAYRLDTPSEST